MVTMGHQVLLYTTHHHHHHKTFLSENRLKSLHEVDYEYSGKFQETFWEYFWTWTSQKGLEVTKSNEFHFFGFY